MCSDPQEITDKETGECHTVACRNCDQCIATRRHGWVARAMAEKATSPQTLCVTLTYDNTTQANRDSAAMFCYQDVREFMNRLRSACRYAARKAKANTEPTVRFICAGEQGSRHGRCHWHLILYSDWDLTRVGKFSRKGRAMTERDNLISRGKHKIRLDWSIWGRGFVTLQEPDQAGMNYVLSYCLKDQFTAEKAAGTNREASAEDFATGLFRMSKRPAIGEVWLQRKMEALAEIGAVLPHLQLKVPGFRGYWHPNGTMREKLLHGMVELNERAKAATGRNAPQWSTLLASCKDSPSDMEILNGPEIEQDEDAESIDWQVGKRNRETAGFQEIGAFRTKCGRRLPCRNCLDTLPESRLASLGLDRQVWDDGFRWNYVDKETGQWPGYGPQTGRPHPSCLRKGTEIARRAFPAWPGPEA